jgi:DNA-binding NtrC family response regulator
MRVLVIHHELESLLLTDWFLEEGHEVFRSGREDPLRWFRLGVNAEIVLLDTGFSNVDLEIVPDLLSAGANVIVVSGVLGESWMDEAFSKGAFGCLKKPISFEELKVLMAAAQVHSKTSPEQSVVLVDSTTVRRAERLIESCEHCDPDGVEFSCDQILDWIMKSNPTVTNYILEAPAKCPNCGREINEKTLIEPS